MKEIGLLEKSSKTPKSTARTRFTCPTCKVQSEYLEEPRNPIFPRGMVFADETYEFGLLCPNCFKVVKSIKFTA